MLRLDTRTLAVAYELEHPVFGDDVDEDFVIYGGDDSLLTGFRLDSLVGFDAEQYAPADYSVSTLKIEV